MFHYKIHIYEKQYTSLFYLPNYMGLRAKHNVTQHECGLFLLLGGGVWCWYTVT